MKTKIFTFLLAGLLLINCKQNNETSISQTTSNETTTSTQTIPPAEFAEALSKAPNAQLIDVRSPKEFTADHLQGAVNIDYNSPEFKAEVEKLDKSKPTFVYCLSGGRSASAMQTMKELGFTNLTELEGGMLKWRNSGVQQTASEETSSVSGMTKTDFEKITRSDKKVLIDFNATWCGPCRKMGPYLDKLKEEYKTKGVAIVKIDVDENPTLCTELKIDGIPHLMLFENGKKVWENIGYIPEEEVRKQL